MTILIDPPLWPAHGRLWSHLVSDRSLAELQHFAAAAGIPARAFERDHYDVPASAYDDLVAAGAVPVRAREILRALDSAGLRRRKADVLGPRPVGSALARPRSLRPGDLVAVVAPASPVPPTRLRAGVDRLRSWGLRVRIGDHVLATQALNHLAGADLDRAADFMAAWTDPDVRAVFAARGGYGVQRMLGRLDFDALAAAGPKILVGFSDITALHEAMATRLGLASIHGPVVTSLGDVVDEPSAEALRTMLFDPRSSAGVDGEPTAIRPGRARGILMGGNLSLLAAGVGTDSSRPASGGLVLIEDIDEAPHRLDRALTQLLHAGWFTAVRGVVLGQFTRCGSPDQVRAVLSDRLAGLGVPVAWGFPCGHEAAHRPVPLGVPAELDADAGTLRWATPLRP